ncbi:alpha/beta hydrolase family protein [Rhizobium aegyptiacum]|uniref:alpha/beta hydrolase family protein n=1 Tax=Rhizobium aegyptiacum TaxID=1764550 RepID=UPI000A91A398|nr:alpha/beta fold hydrolase [Rhizobium aegyptiacum]
MNIMGESLAEGSVVRISSGEHQLSGRYFAPMGAVRANLVLHGATGVPARYYRAFATWAAEQGIGVLTYDYRDFGASRRGPIRESRATMADWGIADQAAAEAALLELAPDGPVWLLGHSLGGLMFPFRRHDKRVARIITVGSGFAHVTDHPWNYRPTVVAFWYLVGPVATALAGYLPGRRLLLGADLPAGIYWQWRRWCTSRNFFKSDVGKSLPEPDFTAPRLDLTMLTMADDVVVPPAAVWRYAAAFPQTSVNRRMLRPEEFGLKSLRHIEVMSERSAPAWPAILGLDGPGR